MPTYPIKFRRDTPENWQAANPVLREGEMGIELPGTVGENGVEAFKYKIGDGVRAWNDLPYASGPAGPSPEYEWNGTSIRFKNPNGTWGDYIDIQGPQGVQGEQGEPGPAGTATPATTTTIGGVIVGQGLEVTAEGCVSISKEYIAKLSMNQLEIGVPRPWRSTTLPPNHCWANGDFVKFADWPDLEQVYTSGGFEGMLMAWNADEDIQAANLGQWRPDAAEPTGLYTPNLSGQFLRCWVTGSSRQAGAYETDQMRVITGTNQLFAVKITASTSGCYEIGETRSINSLTDSYRNHATANINTALLGEHFSGDTTHPENISQPHIIYLGNPA